MAQFADGSNAEDLSLLHPGDDEFLQELLGSEVPSLDGVSTLVSRLCSRPPDSVSASRSSSSSSLTMVVLPNLQCTACRSSHHDSKARHAQGTEPWDVSQGGWPSLPPLEQATSSASPARTPSGDAGDHKPSLAQLQHGFDQQLQSPRNGGGSDGAPKSARQRRLEINRRSQTLYRERQKVPPARLSCRASCLLAPHLSREDMRSAAIRTFRNL